MIIPADITTDPRYKNHHPLINPSIPISSSAAFAISILQIHSSCIHLPLQSPSPSHGRQGRHPGRRRRRAGRGASGAAAAAGGGGEGEVGDEADGPAGGAGRAPGEPAGGAVDGGKGRPGAPAVRHHGRGGGGGAGEGPGGEGGEPDGAHPRLLQHLEPQGRGARLQHLAQPEDGAVDVGGGDGEAEPGGEGAHGGRLREAVQADIRRRRRRRAPPQGVRLLPLDGDWPRGRHALPHRPEPRLLQRPAALLHGALRPGRLELLQGDGPARQGRRRRAGGHAGEVRARRHRGRPRVLVHGVRQLRQGRAPPLAGRLGEGDGVPSDDDDDRHAGGGSNGLRSSFFFFFFFCVFS